jgi:uncharacterized protein YegJ (DUF2314 family)
VVVAELEIEDWMYTDGKQHIGGFQAMVLKNRQKP